MSFSNPDHVNPGYDGPIGVTPAKKSKVAKYSTSDKKQMEAVFELVNEYVISNQIGATETVVLKQFTSWVQKQHRLSTL